MKMLRLALLGLVLCTTTGCPKLAQTLTLTETGSGSFEVSYSIPEQAIDQLKAMASLHRQMVAASGQPFETDQGYEDAYLFLDPDEDALRAKIGKYKANGVEIEQMNVQTRNAWRQVHLKIRFRDIGELAETDFFNDYGFSLYKSPKGNYVLYREAPEAEHEYPTNLDDPKISRSLTPILGGFNVTVHVNTPTQILKTNAQRHTAHTASWQFDYDRDPNAFVYLQKQTFMIVFDGRGLSLPQIKRSATSG